MRITDIDFVDFENFYADTPDEFEEDEGIGGYVPVSKIIGGVEQIPRTEISIANEDSGFPWRLHFESGGRYKLFSYYNNQEITSDEVMPHPALYLQGLEKSETPGQEHISLQVEINGTWTEVDAITFTIGAAATVEWREIEGLDNLDEHPDPWAKGITGQRIFPDFKTPLHQE
ncbi:MAG: hypothetical protein HC845_06365, partial [Akkermansiaceae bacterium]|nr:hypothetical protein [Akkermansiaceae bacterium]